MLEQFVCNWCPPHLAYIIAVHCYIMRQLSEESFANYLTVQIPFLEVFSVLSCVLWQQ
jgi:hypothetical protein